MRTPSPQVAGAGSTVSPDHGLVMLWATGVADSERAAQPARQAGDPVRTHPVNVAWQWFRDLGAVPQGAQVKNPYNAFSAQVGNASTDSMCKEKSGDRRRREFRFRS